MHIFDQIEKPVLLLDEEATRRNIQRMANRARLEGVHFRPHFKTHQSAEIGEWFRAEEVTAITASSLVMAEYFAGYGGKTVHDTDRMRYATDQFYFKSPEEMHVLWRHVPEAGRNTLEIADRCNLEIETAAMLPPFEVPPGETSDIYFERVVRGGFAERRKHLEMLAADGMLKHPIRDYEERLDAEVGMIRQMRFSSYFLIVWDLIKHARDNGIPVGPGRGSVVGSLVAYSLRITDIDPLQYSLFFERFLNPERIAPPDIDMDFCMHRRAEVIDYVASKYGRDSVCQIITFGTMAARGVIRDVGRVLDIPYADVDRIAKLIPGELNATIDKALEQEPRLRDEMGKSEPISKLIEIAKRLEGLSRHASTHAAR